MTVSLEGRKALVCGSTQGIGLACAIELAREGAEVTLMARHEEALAKAAAELPAAHNQAHESLVADFADWRMVRDRAARHVESAGPVHILLNNTGGPAAGALVEATPDELLGAFSQHILCNQVLMQAVVPGMRQAGYGRIINIVSTSVIQPIRGLGVSNVIRGAVGNWAGALAGELGPFGITVNNVLPGYTRTARLGTLIEGRARRAGASPEEIEQQMIVHVPLGRFATPQEIGAVAAFLATPAASYLNGVNLPVDGGRLAVQWQQMARVTDNPVGSAVRTILNYIDGTLTAPASGSLYFDDLDPATGAACARVPDSDGRDVDAAVQAAAKAFPAWSATPAEQRSRILLRIAALIEERLEELARLETTDTGKPLAMARALDIPRAVANFRFFATAILHTRTEAHQTDGAALNLTLRAPRGVAGLISPWNLPLYLLSWKVAPALATGNAAVAKPSELSPMTANRLAELCIEAGLPPGVLNIVHGYGEKAGAAIVGHPDVPAISFTGGTDTGAAIARTAGPMFKRLSLECGGKNPTIVFADADLDETLPATVRAAFANQGETCLCGSRILVERAIHDRFVEGFVDCARKLRVGDPMEEGTDQGALISSAHRAKVEGCVELARQEGGTILCGGKRPPRISDRCRNGFFLEPTVIAGLDARCRTNREEIFGPVVTIIPFQGEQEAIELANATRYGLAASVWTRSLGQAHRVAAGLQIGTVWINCWLLRDLRVPFGGMKESGIGREGGEDAIRFFTEPKNVCIKL